VLIAVLLVRGRQVRIEAGLLVLVSGVIIAAAALAVALVAALEIWRRGHRGLAPLARGVLAALVVLAWPGLLAVQAVRLPVLNDISTNLDDPPAFSRSQVVLSAREGHVPPTIDRAVRERQRLAYPGLRTVLLDNEPAEAFQIVQKAVKTLKWRVIEEAAPDERFRDDITIRLRWTGSQTRIDIRSASRVGRHDFGANARRIQKLIEEINNPST
jgi:hypothetical protein